MWMLLAPAAVAQVAPAVDAADAPAVQEMIRDQIGAFQRDDAGSAWKHVAPGLKAKFGTADRFLEVVREGYRPVYRPEEYTFRELTRWDGEPAQWLDVTGPDGGRTAPCTCSRSRPTAPGARPAACCSWSSDRTHRGCSAAQRRGIGMKKIPVVA